MPCRLQWRLSALPGESVVVGNSTDHAGDVARRRDATVVFQATKQISRARDTGAGIARGRYLIFVDADTILSPDLLSWFSGFQTLGLLVSMAFFPLTSRYRSLCRYWCRRPRLPVGGRGES